MKYRTVWKHGGHPRGSCDSMKLGRRQTQVLKPRGTISGKGVENLGGDREKIA